MSVSFEQLNSNIHELTEQSNVLKYLITDRQMCDTSVTNEVFFRFMNQAKSHLEMEDKEIYRDLLSKGDTETRNTANRFMSGSQELKRLLDKHVKRWTDPRHKKLVIGKHSPFIKDTEELTDLMLDRLQDETEKLYPLIRTVGNS